jgi:hypothetical protein
MPVLRYGTTIKENCSVVTHKFFCSVIEKQLKLFLITTMCMKSKVTISICVGFEKGMCELALPVNLQPSSKSLQELKYFNVSSQLVLKLDTLREFATK